MSRSEKPLCKCGWIRSDRLEGKECPFGLPITLACKNAGESVSRMCPLKAVSEEKRKQVEKANKRVYTHEKTGQRCMYAHDIIEKTQSVNCDFGDVAEGMSTPAFAGSPLYAQTFGGIGLDGLYAFPLGFYADNNESRNLFQGLFSLLGSATFGFSKEACEEDYEEDSEADELSQQDLEKCRSEFEDDRTDAAKVQELAGRWGTGYPEKGR